MSSLMGYVGLAFIWLLLVGEFSGTNFVVGLVVGYLVMWIARPALYPPGYVSKEWRLANFLGYFIKELLVANVQVAKLVLQWEPDVKPGIIAIPLDAKTDTEITMFSNLITLTPGSLSLDLSRNERVLTVHAINVDDAQVYINNIKSGLEAKVLDVLR
ncbi:MAG: Na+/H+ antiporter subunit E [Anaerolineae bacterium]|nr:Na+/H+ antiporter subunit E [Anaerolineae bacterium]